MDHEEGYSKLYNSITNNIYGSTKKRESFNSGGQKILHGKDVNVCTLRRSKISKGGSAGVGEMMLATLRGYEQQFVYSENLY